MKNQLQITFRGLDPSEHIDAYVRKHAAKLERFSSRIIGCHVVIEAPNHRRHHGHPFRVRIDLKMPGHELVLGSDPPEREGREDLYAAIDEAFDDAERVLLEYVRKQRGHVKNHDRPAEES